MTETKAAQSYAFIYVDGELSPLAEASLPLEDQGLLNGLGFYETFRTSGGLPHLWPLHRRRLEQACAIADITLGPKSLALDEPRLAATLTAMLERADVADAVFRYTVIAGRTDAGGRSSQPHELLSMRAIPPPAPREGICLHVLNLPRDSGEWLPRPKSINCANALLGAAELRRRGAGEHDEGLFLSRAGEFVVETTRQNIAWIRDGRLCYPQDAVGPIAGTCLTWIVELGAPVAGCRASLDELVAAEAIFVMNSVRGLTPVREIRGRDGAILVSELESHRHPLVASLSRQWDEALAATAAAAG